MNCQRTGTIPLCPVQFGWHIGNRVLATWVTGLEQNYPHPDASRWMVKGFLKSAVTDADAMLVLSSSMYQPVMPKYLHICFSELGWGYSCIDCIFASSVRMHPPPTKYPRYLTWLYQNLLLCTFIVSFARCKQALTWLNVSRWASNAEQTSKSFGYTITFSRSAASIAQDERQGCKPVVGTHIPSQVCLALVWV